MFSGEIRSMLVEVITSWQVIVVTVVLVIYITIVKSVGRTHHHIPRPVIPKAKKTDDVQPDSEPAASGEEMDTEESSEE